MSSGHNILVNNIPCDIFQRHFFNYSVIGTPVNASYINNGTCLKITGNTTVTLNQYSGNINFVVVGGGQRGIKNGGYGGGYAFGSIVASVPLTITIGAAESNTSITGTSISIVALAGSSTGNGYTNQSGNTVTINGGGRGGSGGLESSYSSQNGSSGYDGYYISRLGIYVCGGGGGGANIGAIGGLGGAGGGGPGGSGGSGTVGSVNTGGGGGGSVNQNGGAAGGSGVVYLFI